MLWALGAPRALSSRLRALPCPGPPLPVIHRLRRVQLPPFARFLRHPDFPATQRWRLEEAAEWLPWIDGAALESIPDLDMYWFAPETEKDDGIVAVSTS